MTDPTAREQTVIAATRAAAMSLADVLREIDDWLAGAAYTGDVSGVGRSALARWRKALAAPTPAGSAEALLREAVAQAVYDAECPLSGDQIATLIHHSEHVQVHDGDKGLGDVWRVCFAIADAVLAALAAAPQPEPEAGGGWMPIETVPVGRPVVVGAVNWSGTVELRRTGMSVSRRSPLPPRSARHERA